MNEGDRRTWNKKQSALRRLLTDGGKIGEARRSLLSQHAQLHSGKLDHGQPWSYEDELFTGLSPAQVRGIPRNEQHSIAWLVWHLARIEDVAMNILVGGTAQIFRQGDWQEKLRIPYGDTGNTMTAADVAALSGKIDLTALRAYRLNVGRSTQDLIRRLREEELDQRVQQDRLDRILKEGAVVESAADLVAYWGRRTVAGLLLMPATRHNFVHLNEGLRIKKKLV